MTIALDQDVVVEAMLPGARRGFAGRPARCSPGSEETTGVILAELARELGTIDGDPSVEVRALAIDSRQVAPGTLFFCLRGLKTDGHAFAAKAAADGAAGLVVEENVDAPGVPQVHVPSTQTALALMAGRFHRHPSRELDIYGATGTNGKTTVTHLVAAILVRAGRQPAVLGTTGIGFRGKWSKLPYTTPTADRFQLELRRLVDAGADALATEVSSHALKTERTFGTRFRAVAFTNLTRDHLDFHGDEEDYLASKLRLFDRQARGDASPVLAVANLDDAAGARFVERAQRSGDRVLTVSRSAVADVNCAALELDARGSRGRVEYAGQSYPLHLGLPGAYNVDNALTAFALTVGAGVEPEVAIEGLESVERIPGRLERVDGGGELAVFVDFAHTPDALETVLSTLRAVTPGRLIAVFGCGGDRDRGKRPQMAAAGTRLADYSVLTSDNPRTEDPQRILDDMVAGVDRNAHFDVEPDRRTAIRHAVAEAEPGDVVVIAGKGHETTQLVGSEALPFDDRDEARAALRAARHGESA